MVFSIQSLMFFIKYYRISNYHNTENQENFLLIYFLGISLTQISKKLNYGFTFTSDFIISKNNHQTTEPNTVTKK